MIPSKQLQVNLRRSYTIPRTATRRIAQLFDTATAARYYSRLGPNHPSTVTEAREKYQETLAAGCYTKIVVDPHGTIAIYLPGCWYELTAEVKS